jgi:hypothetical protein
MVVVTLRQGWLVRDHDLLVMVLQPVKALVLLVSIRRRHQLAIPVSPAKVAMVTMGITMVKLKILFTVAPIIPKLPTSWILMFLEVAI